MIINVLDSKFYLRYAPKNQKGNFDKLYGCLYDGIKTDVQGAFHYYSVYLLRKLAFAMVVYYLSDPEWSLF